MEVKLSFSAFKNWLYILSILSGVLWFLYQWTQLSILWGMRFFSYTQTINDSIYVFSTIFTIFSFLFISILIIGRLLKLKFKKSPLLLLLDAFDQNISMIIMLVAVLLFILLWLPWRSGILYQVHEKEVMEYGKDIAPVCYFNDTYIFLENWNVIRNSDNSKFRIIGYGPWSWVETACQKLFK